MSQITKCLLLSSVLLVAFSASAACGGGGWHPRNADAKQTDPSAKPAAAGQSQTPVTQAAPAVVRPAVEEVVAVRFDSSRFDAVSAKLELTEKQLRKISKAKENITDDSAKLVRNHDKAQSKYASCEGNCDGELRRLRKAADELKAYNPNQEFDKRLEEILHSDQWSAYLSTTKKSGSQASQDSTAATKKI